MEERDYVELSFSYTDEFGNTTDLSQHIILSEEIWNIENMLEEYKRFLFACGYNQALLDRIKYKGGE